ncbi:MAG: NAD-dependent epimerase/dehydratase family protein [Gaiellaceae bacterium]
MRALVTGATGFVGSRLVGRLLERDDTVVGLARSPSAAQKLIDRGCKFVQGSLTQEPAVRAAVQGCDVVFHLGGVTSLGITRSERGNMETANIGGTELLFEAAVDEGVGRIVYASSLAAFGNTKGQVVDETFNRTDPRFLSWYERTKYLAHQTALSRIRDGAPIVIVQPGHVYGPGDHSLVGEQIERAAKGTLRYRAFPELGLVLTHVDDVVEGILQAAERGELGRSYILGGERTTLGAAIQRAARAGGNRAPTWTVPSPALKALAPLSRVLSRVAQAPPNLGEIVNAAENVTYWATDERARRELGYTSRSLDEGLSEMFAENGSESAPPGDSADA